MGLVSAKEVAKAINLDKYGVLGTFVGWSLMHITRVSSLNRFYNRHMDQNGLEFCDTIVKHYQIDFDLDIEELGRLPKKGAFITISNHPLGGIDGVLLLKLALEKRPDFKIMANFLLQRIQPLKPYIMAVNPFEGHKDAMNSIIGFKTALKHLKEGHPLGIFPAGEVSTYKDDKLVVDKPWEEAAIKLIRRAEVPVVPIYFHAKNSRMFYRLSKINDIFRTAKLPSEVTSQSRRPIKVRIGKPISVQAQKEEESLEDFTELLRKKTYLLANVFEKERLIDKVPSIKIPKSQKKIATAVRPEVLLGEVEKLSLIHISEPRDKRQSRMPSSA